MARWKKKRARGKRIICSVDKRPIHGRVHYWHHQPMCRNCYSRFTGGVRLARPEKPKGFFSRLFGL